MSENVVVNPRLNPLAGWALGLALVSIIGFGVLIFAASAVRGAPVIIFGSVLSVVTLSAVVLGVISMLPRYKGRPGRLFGGLSVVLGCLVLFAVYVLFTFVVSFNTFHMVING